MQSVLDALERYQVKRQDFDRFSNEISALQAVLLEPESRIIGYARQDDLDEFISDDCNCNYMLLGLDTTFCWPEDTKPYDWLIPVYIQDFPRHLPESND